MNPISKRLFISCSILIASWSLSGCSFVMDFFIVNSSGNQTTIVVKGFTDYAHINNLIPRRYTESKLSIDKNTALHLTKQLSYVKLDTSTLSVIIPANSTVHFSHAFNRPLEADSIIVMQESSVLRFAVKDLGKFSKRDGFLSNPIRLVYTIH